jgi:hypothetical protein
MANQMIKRILEVGLAVALVMGSAAAWVGLVEQKRIFAQPTPPAQPQACAGGVTVLLEGQPLASGCVLNLKAGPGIIATPKADPTIGGTDLIFGYNTATMATLDEVHANVNYLVSSNGTPACTASLSTPGNKALTVYQAGELFLLNADAACTSLNIDNVGARTFVGTLTPGTAKLIWFDGTVFRLV